MARYSHAAATDQLGRVVDFGGDGIPSALRKLSGSLKQTTIAQDFNLPEAGWGAGTVYFCGEYVDKDKCKPNCTLLLTAGITDQF